jgi:hypothetical protein
MGLFSKQMERARKGFVIPEHARLCRTLGFGLHSYLAVLPRALESLGMRRVAADPLVRHGLLSTARVRISAIPGYAFIDTRTPCICLSWVYYKLGTGLDLYLDLLHELTHLRQLQEGADLWDRHFSYVDRITEIEGYAVAVEEGRRLGMTESELARHLHNPWMSARDVTRLQHHIDDFLARAGPPPQVER